MFFSLVRTDGGKRKKKKWKIRTYDLPVVRKPGRRLNGPGSFDRNRETPHYFHVEIASTNDASRCSRAVNRRRCQSLVDPPLIDLWHPVVERIFAVRFISQSPLSKVVDAFSSLHRASYRGISYRSVFLAEPPFRGRMLIYNLYSIRSTSSEDRLLAPDHTENVFAFVSTLNLDPRGLRNLSFIFVELRLEKVRCEIAVYS